MAIVQKPREYVFPPEVHVSENSALLIDMLAEAKVEIAASLPDTWIMDALHGLDEDPRFTHIIVNREESAIGICAGAFMGGKGSAALMGTSGFMASIYAISKICNTYQIGFPIICTVRGEAGDREVNHQSNGMQFRKVLTAMDIHLHILGDRQSYEMIPEWVYHSKIQKRPVIIGMTSRI
jgi:sulfopyruvate decarboxylase TPP-binding subunit